MSHPGYPNAHSVLQIVQRLRAATAERVYEFWPDNQSLLDEHLIML
jgi:hypothetical protein